jgi:peptidoglycan hydrolase-like protein with peptidoglycan-binding domain
MKAIRLFSIATAAGAWITFSAAPLWTQTAPAPEKDQTKMKQGEKTGETGQSSPRMERKKGEEEMEARGAQKPGRMEKSGAEAMGTKENQGQQWAAQDIKKAQEALKNNGHDPGSMDGVMGPQTRQAIKAFQSASGLKETGTLDRETAEKLGVEKGTAPPKGSTSMGKGSASPTQKDPSSTAR